MMPMQPGIGLDDDEISYDEDYEDIFIDDAINDSGLSPLSLSPTLLPAANVALTRMKTEGHEINDIHDAEEEEEINDSFDSESQTVPLNAPIPLKEKVKNGTVSLALSPCFAIYGILVRSLV